MNLPVTCSDYTEFLKHAFIEGNDTPLFQEDIQTYGFSFSHEISDESMLAMPNLNVKAVESKVDPEFFLDK